jgi:hypothetical protein
MGPAPVHRDPHDPRSQRSLSIPAPQAAEHPKKNLLADVFCIVPVVQKPHAQPKDVRLETLHERANRICIVPQAASDQCGIV